MLVLFKTVLRNRLESDQSMRPNSSRRQAIISALGSSETAGNGSPVIFSARPTYVFETASMKLVGNSFSSPSAMRSYIARQAEGNVEAQMLVRWAYHRAHGAAQPLCLNITAMRGRETKGQTDTETERQPLRPPKAMEAFFSPASDSCPEGYRGQESV